MTQPPYGQGQSPDYPRQQLLPQQVKPGRSRVPLVIAAGVLAVVLVGVLVLLRVMHDRGEQSRTAYCAALRTAIHGSNLLQVISEEVNDDSSLLMNVRDLAPDSVRNQWDDLFSLASEAPGSRPSIGDLARAVTDLKAIVDDADTNCGLKIQIPI